MQRATASAKLATIFGATVVANPQPETLIVETQNGSAELRFKKLILATGARERFLPFPGWTLPGVMGAGGLQALVKSGLPDSRRANCDRGQRTAAASCRGVPEKIRRARFDDRRTSARLARARVCREINFASAKTVASRDCFVLNYWAFRIAMERGPCEQAARKNSNGSS